MSKKNRNQSGHPPNLHHMNIDAQLRHARGESNRVKSAAKPNPKSSQELEKEIEQFAIECSNGEWSDSLGFSRINSFIAQHDATVKAKILGAIGEDEAENLERTSGRYLEIRGANRLRKQLRQVVINIFESEEVA